jgi:pyruvate/2-oxoglutarate dehydrogenase complex dihydrolipoamide dehydrogenase (E3) component
VDPNPSKSLVSKSTALMSWIPKKPLDWTVAPKRIAVIGGGVIGMEIGMLFQKFGSQVTVVELSPNQLLPGTDTDVAKALEKICTKRKMTLHLEFQSLGI